MLADREQLEAQESAFLAPYAQHSGASRGRQYPGDEHDYRTAYQRDRDRILHTTAFRRLEYKTQVFVNYEGDHYRTRLTHTLEVAGIARTMARALRLNQDLAETIAMAHDLGHTPFGHSGEAALHELMAAYGGFNHNTQGLRIVELLEERYPEFPGLNLTWEVREGIIKHATDYDTPEAEGYEPQCRASLEGQLINLADEVAYNTHDLDDGLRSGLIRPAQLREVALWRDALAALGIAADGEINALDRNRVIRYLVNAEVTAAIEATLANLAAAAPQSVDDARHQPADLVAFGPEMRERNRELKAFLLNNLYRHWRVMRMQEKARRVVARLFETYIAEPQQLPFEVQARAVTGGLERVVCDYVAGMTDRYALQEWRKLFDPEEPV
jgi:dGTPase